MDGKRGFSMEINVVIQEFGFDCNTNLNLKVPFRGRWAGRKAGSEEVGPPCGNGGLCAFFKENDLFRLSAKTQAFSPKSTFP